MVEDAIQGAQAAADQYNASKGRPLDQSNKAKRFGAYRVLAFSFGLQDRSALPDVIVQHIRNTFPDK